jgi:triosephosphate isomerase
MIIASNFKTNHTRSYTKHYLSKLDNLNLENIKVAVFPPATALFEHSLIGSQNIYPTFNGSFTGDIGLEQLNEFNIRKILIGHSERREVFKESQELIDKKFNFCKENDFDIYYCIGENIEIRKKGLKDTINFLKSQLKNIDLNYQKLIIAYEPVWAIGTGVSATIKEIEETHNALREFIKAPILYGGSVKLENIKEIVNLENVDGALIGTASWDIDNFIKIIEEVK